MLRQTGMIIRLGLGSIWTLHSIINHIRYVPEVIPQPEVTLLSDWRKNK